MKNYEKKVILFLLIIVPAPTTAFKGKGKRKSSEKKLKEESSKTSLVPDKETYPLGDSFKDYVQQFYEFGTLFSTKLTIPTPKKRCLRSSSNEEKEATSASISPGPSSYKASSLLKKSESIPSCSKRGELSDSKKIFKATKSVGSKSKEEKSPSKGKTRGKKTGSCASNRFAPFLEKFY